MEKEIIKRSPEYKFDGERHYVYLVKKGNFRDVQNKYSTSFYTQDEEEYDKKCEEYAQKEKKERTRLAIQEEARQLKEKRRLEDPDALMNAVFQKRGNGKIQSAVEAANERPDYKRRVQMETRQQESKNKKRTVNNRPKKLPFKTKLKLAFLTLAASAGIITAAEIPVYKNHQAERVLTTVKQELGAEKIWSNSSITGSNSSYIEQTVTKDGKTYRYIARLEDGNIIVIEDELSPEVREAIAIVAKTQSNGYSIFDAMKADNLADKIENGELDLSVGEQERLEPTESEITPESYDTASLDKNDGDER